MRNNGRVVYIDGIRGWAAVMVLLFHMFWEMFGTIIPEFRSDHLRLVMGGHLAVCIFFVLSGDALSTPYLQSKRSSAISKIAVRRYFRLAIPIAIISLTVYVLMRFSLTANHGAAAILANQWLDRFLSFEPSFIEMVRYASFEVFIERSPSPSYHAFLWTMPVEMLGSLLVFVYLFMASSLRRPLACAIALAALLLAARSYLGLFFVGVSLAQLRVRGVLDEVAAKPACQPFSALFLITTYLLYCYVGGQFSPTMINVITAIALVVGIYLNSGARAFFASAPSRALGYLSFPIYLVHFAVLVSITSAAVVFIGRDRPIGLLDATLIAVTSTAISFVAAWLLAAVERFFQFHTNAWLDRAVVKFD